MKLTYGSVPQRLLDSLPRELQLAGELGDALARGSSFAGRDPKILPGFLELACEPISAASSGKDLSQFALGHLPRIVRMVCEFSCPGVHCVQV